MSVFCIRFLSVFFFILFLIYKQTLKINFNLKCAKIILLMKMNLILNLISLVLCQNQDRRISPYLELFPRIGRGNGFPFMSESVCNPSGPSNLGDVIIIIFDQ